MDTGSIQNKFKFITIAAARCYQLQRGARPRLDSRSHKHVTIAQEEVREGLIECRVPEESVDSPIQSGREPGSETGDAS